MSLINLTKEHLCDLSLDDIEQLPTYQWFALDFLFSPGEFEKDDTYKITGMGPNFIQTNRVVGHNHLPARWPRVDIDKIVGKVRVYAPKDQLESEAVQDFISAFDL